ncbi:MAG: PAS domain S-box protein [Desulfobacterales bacterium]|nr:PAS domain S-box protein [Desulfobacterales bacterium]
MTTATLIGFLNNAALLMALAVIYDVVFLRQPDPASTLPQIPLGIILGILGIGIMLNPWEVLPGVIFDTRSVLLCVTGFFFGPVTTLITVALTGGYRLILGGTGAWTGFAVIAASGAIGLAWRHLRKKDVGTVSPAELYVLGLVTHGVMLLLMLTLPRAIAWNVLSKISVPVMLVFPLGTVLLGKLMINRHRRLQSEQALAASEEKYRSLVGSMTDWVWAIDLNGVHTFSNAVVENLLGYRSNEVVGNSAFPLMHTDSRNQAEATVAEAIAQKKGWTNLELKWLHKDGSTRLFQSSAHPAFDAEGNLVGISGIDHDITERKSVERALRESEETFRNLADNSLVGIYFIQDDRFQYVNPKFAAIFGYSVAECLADIPFQALVHPDDRALVEDRVHRRESGEIESDHHTFQGLRKNGDIVEVEVFGSSIRLDQKPAAIGTVLDITASKQTARALVESEKLLRKIAENFPNSYVSIIEPDYTVGFTSGGEFKQQNLDPDTFIGLTLEQVFHDQADTVKPYYARTFRGEACAFELCIDQQYQLYRSVPIYAEDGTIPRILVVVENITQRKQLEAQLQQAQKMETIGTLAGGIAHDFNNILFPIVGHAELLKEDVPPDSPLQNSIGQIYAGSLRARDLVKQILTFSRQDNHQVKLMRIQPIIKEALKMLQATIPAPIEIKPHVQADCGVIKADPTQIHQVVMNLATNAYHAMEAEGGELEIALEQVDLDAQDVTNLNLEPGPYACIRVADTGVGMDKDVARKIFDPFFTTKKQGKGTGMGLAVVHGSVHNAGGAIRVNSAPGRGTECNVYLPVVKSTVDERTAHVAQPLPGGTERILLVDDEQAIVFMVKQTLARLGYQVTAFTDSLEALEAFRAGPDRFDVVITDLAMPKMSGDRLVAELNAVRPGIPILLCTGFSEKIPADKTAAMGITTLLMKPIVRKDLAEKIRAVLDKTANSAPGATGGRNPVPERLCRNARNHAL